MPKILMKGCDIEHVYKEGKIITPVLKGVNLDIEASKMTAIVGKSGSGKSTLLHILGTLDTPTKGSVHFNDLNLTTMRARDKAQFRNRHMGFVYQFHHLLGDFTALENVMLPLLIGKIDRKLCITRALYLLERVGLAHLKDHYPSELSGGERQRVAIARALVHSPEVILADEPTGNLDEENASIVFKLFKELVQDEGTAVVMVTHDMSLASQCDHIFEIVNGVITNTRRFGNHHDDSLIAGSSNAAFRGDSTVNDNMSSKMDAKSASSHGSERFSAHSSAHSSSYSDTHSGAHDPSVKISDKTSRFVSDITNIADDGAIITEEKGTVIIEYPHKEHRNHYVTGDSAIEAESKAEDAATTLGEIMAAKSAQKSTAGHEHKRSYLQNPIKVGEGALNSIYDAEMVNDEVKAVIFDPKASPLIASGSK